MIVVCVIVFVCCMEICGRVGDNVIGCSGNTIMGYSGEQCNRVQCGARDRCSGGQCDEA